MDRTLQVHLTSSDRSSSDENGTVLDKNSNNSARRDRTRNKSDQNPDRDSVDDKRASDENETVLDKSSNNSAPHDHEVNKSSNRGRKERDSGERSASPGSQRLERNVRSVEGHQTQTKVDPNKTAALSKTPGKKRSIFDFEEDDDDVFQKKTPKNVRPADSRQQAKKLRSRRSSRIFELKKQSLNQSGMDDEIDETEKKRSKVSTEPNRRKSEKPSTSSQMSQTENLDDSDDETGEEDAPEIDEQRKARATARSRSAHNQRILKILNQSSEANLKSLSRIGPKTATMLYQYRKLHGKFASIMDLEDMPGWTPRVFEQFLKANNIILD